MALEPITRAEQIMYGESLEPITREEMFLAKAAGMDVTTPEPITRREMFLSQISGGSGGTTINNQDKTITQNGTYTADEGYTGLGNVTVNVAESGGEMEEQFVRAIERNTSKPITELPAGLTEIGKAAFRGCPNLIITSLPEGVTKIGNTAFYECSGLKLTSLPSGLTLIDVSAFYACPDITISTIPAGVKTIGNMAFYMCVGLTEITFEGTPNSIGNNAFTNSYNIKTINVPWAEGEVAGAPWSATNATINYNYTGG